MNFKNLILFTGLLLNIPKTLCVKKTFIAECEVAEWNRQIKLIRAHEAYLSDLLIIATKKTDLPAMRILIKAGACVEISSDIPAKYFHVSKSLGIRAFPLISYAIIVNAPADIAATSTAFLADMSLIFATCSGVIISCTKR